MRRQREEKSKPAPRRGAAADRFAQLDGALLAAVTGLLVATPLIPSEATVHQGTTAPLNLLWLLVLFAWTVGLVLRPNPQLKFGWAGLAAAALIGWHSLSALTVGMNGNSRQALNMLWQFISYGVAAFLLRQLLRSGVQCRALLVVMIALASVEATQGHYEYFVIKPQQRAEFAKNPDAVFREVDADTPTAQQQFRWRLESVEPLGTFALTNSLAGLLAPWLIVLLGIGLSLLGRQALLGGRDHWLPLGGVLLLAAIMAGCLLLTKSRTGILATGAGVALLALYARPGGWHLSWKVPAAAAAVLVVLGLAAVVVGGLDVQVLSQAPTSVLYRIQYWQSTAAMIADHPLLGCGPGQFQEHYTRYKLPQASETVADPHNFLLEIWATAGTPALLALLALAAAFVWQMSRGRRAEPPAESPAELLADRQAESPANRFVIYAGGVAGLVLAFPLGLVVGWPPPVTGFPIALVAVWLLDGWVSGGRLPTALPVIALVVLLVNLLAAGATSFPGVFSTFWLLLPVALSVAQAPAWIWSPPRAKALLLLLTSLVLVLASARTQLSPVLGAASHLAQAHHAIQTSRHAQAESMLTAAAQLDPWSPDPWQLLAEIRLQVWLQSQQPDDWRLFLAAAMEYGRRDPRHHAQFSTQGHWLLAAWRKSGDERALEEAIDAYRLAVAWYPGRAVLHAQLAWALHLAGREEEATAAADLAWRLDGQNPHREQKLDQQTIYDPEFDVQPQAVEPDNAEQIVRRLRSSSGTEDMP